MGFINTTSQSMKCRSPDNIKSMVFILLSIKFIKKNLFINKKQFLFSNY